MKYHITLLLMISVGYSSQAQFNIDFNNSFNHLIESCDSSQDISTNSHFDSIQLYKQSYIPKIISKFSDNSPTTIYSKCLSKYLNKGEVAIIIIDHFFELPYYALTGYQNCLAESCPNNPIEFYIPPISRNVDVFIQKFNKWYSN